MRQLQAEVLAVYAHDARWYTQGLIYWQGDVLESHGGYGKSGLVRYPLQADQARPSRRRELDADLFAEGLERVGNQLIQLTWRSGRVLRWDAETFEAVGEYRLEGEGWGLAYDGEVLWVSNGTHLLTAYDPQTFQRRGRVAVYRGRSPQTQLNELEWAEGALWANVYETDEIVRIEIREDVAGATGRGVVTAVVDASGLLSNAQAAAAEVLNGIAYRPETKTFFVTGKYWPRLFEVRFVPTGD